MPADLNNRRQPIVNDTADGAVERRPQHPVITFLLWAIVAIIALFILLTTFGGLGADFRVHPPQNGVPSLKSQPP